MYVGIEVDCVIAFKSDGSIKTWGKKPQAQCELKMNGQIPYWVWKKAEKDEEENKSSAEDTNGEDYWAFLDND